mmetsp:Transcript_39793/g.79545  ORF Transcript_39793/g.79545 Transcript_39793/m.79545 type:complete len:235 (-) Transcript_39793:128-832(-)
MQRAQHRLPPQLPPQLPFGQLASAPLAVRVRVKLRVQGKVREQGKARVELELRAESAQPGACSADHEVRQEAEGRLGAWRRQHALLWAAMHTAVGPIEVKAELDRRMIVQRTKQVEAYKRSVAAFVRDAEGSTVPSALRSSTRMAKLTPIEMRLPAPDWPADDLRRVAQARPTAGGPGRLAYVHTPPELLRPLEAFAEWPVGFVFSIEQLPARNCFLQACAARSLLSLGVVAFA